MMIIKKAEFVKSSTTFDQFPQDNLPEFAFIGRSNVGKSSLINMLTGRKELAKTSATPGKTRLVNHFVINNLWYLVDLPGYGYARTSKVGRAEFSKIINHYIIKSQNLFNLFVLIDSRIKPQKIDLDFINNLGEHGVPFNIIFTKIDKISPKELEENTNEFKQALSEAWEELPLMFFSSATKQNGKEEILTFVENSVNKKAN